MYLQTGLQERRAQIAARALRYLSFAVVISCLLTLIFAGLNYMSLGRGGKERISQAFASGALVEDLRAGDTSRGRSQFTDCLILGMALDQRSSKLALSVSPTIPYPGETEVCKALRSDPPNGRTYYYHNYLHGHTALVRYLLPLMAIDQIRSLYRAHQFIAVDRCSIQHAEDCNRVSVPWTKLSFLSSC